MRICVTCSPFGSAFFGRCAAAVQAAVLNDVHCAHHCWTLLNHHPEHNIVHNTAQYCTILYTILHNIVHNTAQYCTMTPPPHEIVVSAHNAYNNEASTSQQSYSRNRSLSATSAHTQSQSSSSSSSSVPHTVARSPLHTARDQKALELAHQVFADLNTSKLGWWHVRAVLAAGSGFCMDGFNINVINLVTEQIARIYYPDWTYWSTEMCTEWNDGLGHRYRPPITTTADGVPTQCAANRYQIEGYANPNAHIVGQMPQSITYAVNAIALAGLVAGQFGSGFLGDRLGRRFMMVLTIFGMMTMAFMSGNSIGTGTESVIATLLAYRFILGIFIGADYPLSGPFVSEVANNKNRGMLVLLVFTSQGVGYLLSEAVASAFAAIWIASNSDPDMLWRVVLISGAVPAALSLYARIMLPESPRFRLFNQLNSAALDRDLHAVLAQAGVTDSEELHNTLQTIQQATNSHQSSASRRSMQEYKRFFRKHGWHLFATSIAWMMNDAAFYSKVLFGLSGVAGADLGFLKSPYMYTGPEFMLQNTFVETLLNLSSIYPGYIAAFLLIDKMGRWKMQQLGFSVMALISAIIAAKYSSYSVQLGPFWVLYSLNGFFNNFGPNSTSYLYPAELYPSEWRSTAAGISAASGKIGAILGTFGFSFMKQSPSSGGFTGAFILLAVSAFIGCLVTFMLPETNGKTLEDISDDVFDIDSEVESASSLRKPVNDSMVKESRNHEAQFIERNLV